MANANTNLLTLNISQSTSSTGSNSKTSQLQSSKFTSKKGGNDFNAALDKANNQINQQNQPAQQNPVEAGDAQNTAATAQDPIQPGQTKDANTASNQGQNQQPQDAPQNIPAEKNIPAEIIVAPTENILPTAEIPTENISQPAEIPTENLSPDIETEPAEIPETPEIQPTLPQFFAPNTETLLPAQPQEKNSEVNLMTIMPKNDGAKSQTMLNLLGGKTWTPEDVQATISPQPLQKIEVNPETLPVHQVGKNLNQIPLQNKSAENLQPQLLNQQQNLNLQQQPIQPQLQTQPVADFNFQPQQVPTQPQDFIFKQPPIQNPQPELNIQPQQQPIQPQIQNQPQIQIEQVQIQVQQVQIQIQPKLQTQPQLEIPNQPVVNSLQPQVESKPQNQPQQISDTSSAIPVENNQNSAPVQPVQETFRQQPEQNQQQTQQNFQQIISQDLNSEVQAQQQSSGGESTFIQNLAPAVDNVSNNQPVAQTQTPEAAAQARENENIPAQIVEHARMIRNAENTEMVINLKPEHLGQLTLRVSVSQNGAVNASFYSDNAQVRAAIENSIVQLKQELNDQGLKVENVQVYAGLTEGGLTNGQSGQAWQQNQQQPANNRRIDFDALQEEIDAVTPDSENISADGVDYKI